MNSVYAICFKNASVEDISYEQLADKICRKIGIDKTTGKLKLSYSLSKARRESYIVDDEDAYVYLTSVDTKGLKPVLRVELTVEPLSRVEGGSSVGVNYGELVSNGRADDVDNCGIRTLAKTVETVETLEDMNPPSIEELENDVVVDIARWIFRWKKSLMLDMNMLRIR